MKNMDTNENKNGRLDQIRANAELKHSKGRKPILPKKKNLGKDPDTGKDILPRG